MEASNRDFFWPSYVDLMTALFAVILVLFVFTYFNFQEKKRELEQKTHELETLLQINDRDAAILRKVKANLKLFETEKDLFLRDSIHNRILLAFDIQYKTGTEYYHITPEDLRGNYRSTKSKLDTLGKKLNDIIDILQYQKRNDVTMKDISYLLVISGSASNLPGDNEDENYLLSYRRALFLYKYWKDSLKLNFDARKYHDIIELQISGSGTGGVGRFNYPFRSDKEEERNQRFIIHITPKLGG